MKYLITVIITCIINIGLSFPVEKERQYTNNINDSIGHKLLQLEYSFFAAQNDTEKYEILLQKLNLIPVNKDFSKTVFEINRIELLSKEVLKQQFFFDTIQNFLFRNQLYSLCIEYIEKDSLANFSPEKLMMKSLCLNEQELYDDVKNTLRNASILWNKDTTLIFSQLQNYNIQSGESKSVLFQALLPGAGMIREGEIKEGFTSFVLNGVFAVTPVLLIQKKLFFSAFSYGLFPLSKFYSGGIKHTRYLAGQNFEKKVSKIKIDNAYHIYQFFKH